MTETGAVVASTVRSQVDLHARFGGVVPEIAGRSHVEHILPVLEETFEQAGARKKDVKAVAVTAGYITEEARGPFFEHFAAA